MAGLKDRATAYLAAVELVTGVRPLILGLIVIVKLRGK
jgi:hypothetical protein